MGYIRLTAATPSYPVSSVSKLGQSMFSQARQGEEQRGIDRLGVQSAEEVGQLLVRCDGLEQLAKRRRQRIERSGPDRPSKLGHGVDAELGSSVARSAA